MIVELKFKVAIPSDKTAIVLTSVFGSFLLKLFNVHKPQTQKVGEFSVFNSIFQINDGNFKNRVCF